MAVGVPETEVFAAADRVLARGERPTVERVRAELQSAAIVVMPSVRTREGNQDGIPVALMEAMASGAAVISTTVSGIPELIEHERDGLLVPPGDPLALADAIERLPFFWGVGMWCLVRRPV